MLLPASGTACHPSMRCKLSLPPSLSPLQVEESFAEGDGVLREQVPSN